MAFFRHLQGIHELLVFCGIKSKHFCITGMVLLDLVPTSYLYTTEYYSAIKRNRIGSLVEMRMDLETVVQSEES